jgi:F-type H+-transporting ATPase subunit delta
MANTQAAKRYAQAAFEIARERGEVIEWRSHLDDIARVLTESQLAPRFADDRLPIDERLALIDRVLDLPPLALNMARVLVSKDRTFEARAVSDAYNTMADEFEGIVQASITTAIELTPEQLTSMEAQLSANLGKQVHAVATVDPALIGGVIIQVGDRITDGSVRTRLKTLRRELEGAR